MAEPYNLVRAERADDRIIVRMLKRWVTTQGAARRFQWLYRRNPQGDAATWLVLDPKTHDIVGFTSIFARGFAVHGAPVLGGVGLDAFVRPDHRRRGIALQLHLASLADIRAQGVPFRFMCGPPVKANLAALVKAGAEVAGETRHWTLPLTLEGLASTLGRGEQAKRWIAYAEPVERLVQRAVVRVGQELDRHLVVRSVEETGPSFDRLWAELSPRFKVIGQRDAAFVRWRYLDNPVCKQEVLAVEQDGRLLGWAAIELAPRGALLVDHLLPLDDSGGGRALRAIIGHVIRRGASRITLLANVSNPYTRLFQRHGFIPGRSLSAFQVLAATELLPALKGAEGWYLRSGDLDPESSRWSVPARPMPWTDPNYVATPEAGFGRPFRRAEGRSLGGDA